MASKIILYILFGIVNFVFGKAVYREEAYSVEDENAVNKILQAILDEGNYDSAKSLSNSRNNGIKPRKYTRNEKYNAQYYALASAESLDRDEKPLGTLENLISKSRNNQLNDADSNVLGQLLSILDNNQQRKAQSSTEEYDNAEDILAFLQDLQNSVGDDRQSKSNRYDNRDDRDDDRSGRNDARGGRDNRNDDRSSRNDRYDDRSGRNNRNDDRVGRNTRNDGIIVRNNRNDDRSGRDNINDDRRGSDYDRRNRDDDRNSRNANRNSRSESRDNNQRARNRIGDNDPLYAKKYKISDDLDAVVLDVSDVDRLLTRINNPRSQQRSPKKAKPVTLNDLDLENIIDVRNNDRNDKTSNVEAVVFDLSQVEDGENIARQIKKLLSQSNAVTLAKDEDAENNNSNRGSLNNRGSLTVKSSRGRSNSKILAHNENNNNVYVPKWLLEEVLAKTNLRDDDLDLKRLLPTAKQLKDREIKLASSPKKIFRRSSEYDVGVPFHLEVQGLGQVNP